MEKRPRTPSQGLIFQLHLAIEMFRSTTRPGLKESFKVLALMESQMAGRCTWEDLRTSPLPASWALPAFMAVSNMYGRCLIQPAIIQLHLNGRHMKLYSREGLQECSSSLDPCASASCPKSCSVVADAPVCLCDWPSYGPRCQHRMSFKEIAAALLLESPAKLHAMNFQGHSYLEMKDELTLSQ